VIIDFDKSDDSIKNSFVPSRFTEQMIIDNLVRPRMEIALLSCLPYSAGCLDR
jgi:hypothetical protein